MGEVLDERELDRRAVVLSLAVLAEVTESHLDGPTPCVGWTVRDLLQHMAAQHHGFAAAAVRETSDADWAAPPGSVADPVGSYRQSAAVVLGAFAALDLETVTLTLPDFGGRTFPARQALRFHAIDYIVHSWDLGTSVGLSVRPDADLLAPALAIALQVPTGEARSRPGAAFGAEIDGGRSDATDQWERILRLLGRHPDWQAQPRASFSG